MATYIAEDNKKEEGIPEKYQIQAAESQKEDAESTAQKESQVSEQKKNKEIQSTAESADKEQDEKSILDKIKKELGKIPQKIEETEDDMIDALRGFLGSSPNIKKVNIKSPTGIEYEKPDFDPDKSINNIKKSLDPLLNSTSPFVSVAGKVPLLGDLMPLLTKLTSDTSGETDISEEELYALCPKQPEIPPPILDKAGKIVKLTGQSILYLPVFLIDVIVQILKVIYDMFKQIKNVLGVPPIPYPFTLIDDLVQLMPKVKKFILTAPPEIEDTVEQKLKKKFHYAAALSVPKPNVSQVSSVKSAASSAASSAKSQVASEVKSQTTESTSTEPQKIEQSQTPPVSSNITETPSVPEVQPKEPIMNDVKPCM